MIFFELNFVFRVDATSDKKREHASRTIKDNEHFSVAATLYKSFSRSDSKLRVMRVLFILFFVIAIQFLLNIRPASFLYELYSIHPAFAGNSLNFEKHSVLEIYSDSFFVSCPLIRH